MAMTSNNNILRPPEASAYTGLSESTLAKRRLRGEPPIFVRLGARAVGYLREDLDAWLESCRRRSTSDPGPSTSGASEISAPEIRGVESSEDGLGHTQRKTPARDGTSGSGAVSNPHCK